MIGRINGISIALLSVLAILYYIVYFNDRDPAINQQQLQQTHRTHPFPKKYHSGSSEDEVESSGSENHRNAIRHYYQRQHAASTHHQRRRLNQYANQHLAKVFSNISL